MNVMTAVTSSDAHATIGVVPARSGGRPDVRDVQADGRGTLSGLGAALAYGNLSVKAANWARLPDDWDGNDGRAPTAEVVASVQSALRVLEWKGAPCPTKCYVAGDGEIGFRWETARGFASLSFIEDGSMVVFVRRESDGATFSIDRPFSFAVLGPAIDCILKVA